MVGLGGLGHMGVKFASAFGADVALFTTSPAKIPDGLRLGAREVVVSKNDVIFDTVSTEHNLNAYLDIASLR